MSSRFKTTTCGRLLKTAGLPLLLLTSQVSASSPSSFQGPSELLSNQKRYSKRDNTGSYSLNTTACGGYSVSSVDSTGNGLQAHLSLNGEPCRAFGVDYTDLLVDVEYQTQERIRVHIYDADKIEFQVPENIFPKPQSDNGLDLNQTDLVFNHQENPFAFWITRRNASDDETPIFDTRPSSKTSVDYPIEPPYGGVEKVNSSTAVPDESGGLVFEAGYLEISSFLPKDANIFGLGEVVATSGFRRNSSATVQTMWARDVGDPENQNMYGDHPIYIETRFNKNGASSSHGVFLLNSEGMDIVLRDEVIEYRPLGGSLDFYFISGPTPIKVIEQYSEISGRSLLHPYWSYGFHLCRWGYDNITQNREIVQSMKDANLPLETFWNDIDWMDTYRNFVPAPNRFEPADYKAFVDELHANNQHYIPIIDAAIGVVTNDTDVYDTFTAGDAANTYIKNPDGSNYIGKVWPGYTVFPDWFQNSTQDWWTEAFINYSQIVEFDGIWIDMNEPSSFCEGSCGSSADLNNITPPFLLPGQPGAVTLIDGTFPEGYNATLWGYSGNLTINGSLTFNSTPPNYGRPDRRSQLSRRVGQGVDVNTPAYEIHNALDKLAISTVSPNATHLNGDIQDIDVHNLFGYMEGIATFNVWNTYKPNKRPFIVSRSTFPGAGTKVAHWLGDNYSTWKYLRYVNQGVLQFQIYGIPMVGADTCGFAGNTDEELCNRWMQLAAFYPFFRNHNIKSALAQEPFRWDSVAEATRNATAIRYALLPYWYTLFYQASSVGTPPIRALFYEFDQEELLSVDAQFLVGRNVLVTGAMYPNITSVEGYLPGGDDEIWRDWYTHEVIKPTSDDGKYDFPAPLGHIPVTIRSGAIFLLHSEPGMTVYDTRESPYSILVSLDKSSEAEGYAFIDDGESFPVTDSREVHLGAAEGKVYGWTSGSYNVGQKLAQVTVLGVKTEPSTVTFNGQAITTGWTYEADLERFVVTGLQGDLNGGWELDWA
uniref:alpha-glucosidase n=1 Tax=Phaffia rhodozyma TaxID=264483 RepID=A0A0U2M4R6_PHARH|nr:alpha-glucosidase [Phaffia rhodozyma]